MSARVWVDFPCNNPDNGACEERSDCVNFDVGGDTALRLYGSTSVVRGGCTGLRVGRRKFRHFRYRYGRGNWCWCGYEMFLDEALELAAYLVDEKGWHAEEGTEGLGFDEVAARARRRERAVSP